LAKTLSFSKTSKELMIAQPAVSKQIKSLEAQFKMQLFIRTKQKVQLSCPGKNLYDKIWPLYSAMCARINEGVETTTKIEGKITFGCLEEVGEKVFIHALNKFKKTNPSIVFEVRFLKAVEIIEGVKSGAIDIGVVPDKIIQENIRIYDLLEEEIILVTGRQNADKKIGKIIELPFVAFRESDPLLEYYLRKVCPNIKLNKLNIEFVINSHKAMIDVIKQNNLYAVLPSLSIRKELAKNEIVNIGPVNLKSKLFLIHRDFEYIDRKIIMFRDFLKEFAKNIV